MLDTDLVAFLREGGTLAGKRFYTGNAPQNTSLPVGIIRRISGNTPRVLGGSKLWSRANFTVDCIGEDYDTALPLANQVRELLDNFNGPMGASSVKSCRCLAEPSDFSEIDGDLILRRVSQDFLFVYAES